MSKVHIGEGFDAGKIELRVIVETRQAKAFTPAVWVDGGRDFLIELIHQNITGQAA